MTLLGAQKLSAEIRRAWRAVGREVVVEIVPLNDTYGKGLFCVRLPGLIGGLPSA
jgi:hypothetical protein